MNSDSCSSYNSSTFVCAAQSQGPRTERVLKCVPLNGEPGNCPKSLILSSFQVSSFIWLQASYSLFPPSPLPASIINLLIIQVCSQILHINILHGILSWLLLLTVLVPCWFQFTLPFSSVIRSQVDNWAHRSHLFIYMHFHSIQQTSHVARSPPLTHHMYGLSVNMPEGWLHLEWCQEVMQSFDDICSIRTH